MPSTSYTIIIPSRNRPKMLQRAIKSALSQSFPPTEIIVVDDGSEPPVVAPGDERIRILRLAPSKGAAGARNAGLDAAITQFVTFLDDDDELLPQMAMTSLRIIEASDLPPPIAALTAIEVVDSLGKVVQVRIPPTLPRGRVFALEEVPRGKSFLSKQTLFIERKVLQSIGGWDETFRTRATTELFLRLNPICSLAGGSDVTYVQHRHANTRLSTDHTLRKVSFNKLLNKHRTEFNRHPRGYLRMLVEHAKVLKKNGERIGYAWVRLRAAWVWCSLIAGRS